MSKKKPSEPPVGEKTIKVHTKSSGAVEIRMTGGNLKTAEAIWTALPFDSEAERWGNEVYFKIPVKTPEEKSQTEVEIGDIAYWPPGESMCIFFGPTPVSAGNKPRAYSPVNVFGKVVGDPLVFKKVKSREKIRVERK